MDDSSAAWLFQQRDAFWRFFAAEKHPGSPHLTDMFVGAEIEYLGHGPAGDSYIDDRDFRYHHTPARAVTLRFRVAGETEKIAIPAPDGTGLFVINGQSYFAPVQRIVVGKKAVEWRRIDHVLADTWTRKRTKHRRLDGQRCGFACTCAQHVVGTDSRGCFGMLRRCLRKVLLPEERGSEWLLRSLETYEEPDEENGHDSRCGNHFHALVRQAAIVTMRPRDPSTGTWQVGRSQYRSMRPAGDGSGTQVRAPDPGVDPFHTPEGKRIGLDRYLGFGTVVGDDRKLHAADGVGFGLASRSIPFLQHNDPRRVLMGCKALGQAVPVVDPEVPAVQTRTNVELAELSGREGLDCGVNLRSGFMYFRALTYEDAVVVSISAAAKLRVTERRTMTIPIPSGRPFLNVTNDHFDHGKLHEGLPIKKGDALVRLGWSPSRLDPSLKALSARQRVQASLAPGLVEWDHWSLKSKWDGRVVHMQCVDLLEEGAPCADCYRYRVDVTIETDRRLEVGDKLCNRHGNKGVVSAILPDSEMPTVDGRPLEIIFSPVGVYNRGNYGQLLEAVSTGTGASPLERVIGDVIVQESPSRLPAELAFSEVQVPSQTAEMKQAVVGYNYILRLPKYASEEFSACGANPPHSTVTDQPPKGIAQKYGEQEMLALQAHGAAGIIGEFCGKRSGSMVSQSAVDLGGTVRPPVADWLRSLGFRIDVADEIARMLRVDLTILPREGIELFSEDAECPDGAELDGPKRNGELALASVERRLESRAFFERNGGAYIDLGMEVETKLSFRGEDFGFRGRYVPVLPPGRRPPSGHGNANEVTTAYRDLADAVRKQQRGDRDGSDGVVAKLSELLTKLLRGVGGKDGIVRQVGLSRRVTCSARMVIVPDPYLPLDTVSLPWDAVRKLFERPTGHLLDSKFQTQEISCDVLATAQACLTIEERKQLTNVVNARLKSEIVLLNRNPSLHKYSVLAFHPRVHFDTRAMRIPPWVTSPFGADFDGDTMTATPVFSKKAKEDARTLTPAKQLFSVADGGLVAAPSKETLLGLHAALNDVSMLSTVNADLARAKLPKITILADGTGATIAEYVRSFQAHEVNVVAAYRVFSHHALRGLDAVTQHSAIGPPGQMSGFLAGLVGSAASKIEEKLWPADEQGNVEEGEDVPLIRGVPATGLRELARERIGIMIGSEPAKGQFGNLARRLLYELRSCEGSGPACAAEMRSAVESIHAITERATQLSLSPKSGRGALEFGPFNNRLIACLEANGDDAGGTDEFRELADELGFDPDDLARHIGNIASQRTPQETGGSLLELLSRPLKAVCSGLELAAHVTDLRMGLFLR
ncbi:MAG: hypothetical protein HN742_35390 [Lentisphaerae bacterium]|jgi:hypothetical protein|nr:hypothetical protein [Lentisphaerota bacterium]MBT4818813.1 hypothetical protein [Lentisphaerota bacterium]MBT5604647.1 hypothetical protein [Lentisphaerota bacterium]MBT7057435.1 hypothetical protein [Lentisphaerota bacterium]MBT7847208.1 hypothetical protein [Lentisphaerota bacterium]